VTQPNKAAVALLHRHFADGASGWSIGTLGAIAEFMEDAGVAREITTTAAGGTVVTERGALEIALTGDTEILAYERLMRDAARWGQGILFCLPGRRAAMGACHVITELGRDEAAIRKSDRHSILFDLGVGAPHVDFCVRTDNPALIAALRGAIGMAALASPAMAAILEHQPHRICRSRLGRIEVFQPIGFEKTPEGPHTHLLPELLKSGRSHSPDTPVPAGALAALELHPASPISDLAGRATPFDGARHAAFEATLMEFGRPDHVAAKARVRAALAAGGAPAAAGIAADERSGRLAARVALRQWRSMRGDDAAPAAWLAAFEGGA
jgi:Family of unknown function (DUF6925)